MKTRIMTVPKPAPPTPRIPTEFTDNVIRYLGTEGRKVSYPEGRVVIHRGEPGKAYYVIISGEVEVRLVGEENRCLPLARLGERTGFGEMALLRGEPASADIVALTPVLLLEYPAQHFHNALRECEDFRKQLMARMALNIQDTSTDTWAFFQRAEAFNMLVHKENRAPEPLVSKSTGMRQLETALCKLAEKPAWQPVLITGEPGTGKLFTAEKVHQLSAPSPSSTAPFIVVDCQKLGDMEACTLLFGSSRPGAGEDQPEGFGTLHLAHRGTLVLRHIETLEPYSREFLARYLELLEFSGEGMFPLVRIIATSRDEPGKPAGPGKLPEELYRLLSAERLHIPPLRTRKADILPLARIFLSRGDGQAGGGLSKNAEEALLAQQYRHNNGAELREAVEMARLFSEGGEILSEHIFTGPKDRGLPPEFDLGEVSLVRRMVTGWFPLVPRALVLAVFGAIIFLCMSMADSAAGRGANLFIWAVWEPLLIFSFLFFGHLWCTVCPLSTAALMAKRLGSLRRAPPPWIKKYGVWFAAAGLFLVTWSERVFHMASNPSASGILLLSLVAGALVFAVVYRRETWCRYICPLGALATAYALSGVLHIRARPHICTAYCTTHECYKGTEELPGCPVFHHPMYISDGHNCKLCLRCLSLCPHDSVRFYLRPLLQAAWLSGGFTRLLAPFSLTLFWLSPVLLASANTPWLHDPVVLTAAALSAILLAAGTHAALPRLLAGGEGADSDPVTAARAANGLAILAWGPLMAYQLSNIPALHHLVIATAPGSSTAAFFPGGGGELSLLLLLQLAVIFVSLLLTTIVLWRISIHTESETGRINPGGWSTLLALVVVYVIFSVLLAVYGLF